MVFVLNNLVIKGSIGSEVAYHNDILRKLFPKIYSPRKIQLALCIHGFHIHIFNQLQIKNTAPPQKNPRKFQEAKLDLPHTEHHTDSMRMKWCVSIPFWSLYANTMPFYVNGHPWIMVSAREEWGQGPWTNLPKIEKWLYKEVCLLKESKQNNTRQVYS